jgi:hypothetical protein
MPRARYLVNSVDYLRGTGTASGPGPFSADAAPEGPAMTWDRAAAIPPHANAASRGETPVATWSQANSWDSYRLRLFPEIAMSPAGKRSLTRTSTHLR